MTLMYPLWQWYCNINAFRDIQDCIHRSVSIMCRNTWAKHHILKLKAHGFLLKLWSINVKPTLYIIFPVTVEFPDSGSFMVPNFQYCSKQFLREIYIVHTCKCVYLFMYMWSLTKIFRTYTLWSLVCIEWKFWKLFIPVEHTSCIQCTYMYMYM